eukprot:gnl/MRDRNA2_/MRDRNA2_332616_c0_seq1.p1 gnl/MRDRNA2_/MRDRNA2_332616_c0~~gnl/MRDRNA2_/MRDRNA2_332616_c0_seq1.p1  ORF type:complete len:206 (-),score=29.32 gnl/MRDRNA2_/MRDRNA2_332616_c0_seq1:67-624(-)
MTLAIGTWGACGRVVIFEVNRYYALFFYGYLAMISFAFIRVISAMFLKDTLASAAADDALALAEKNRNPRYVKELWGVFQELDMDRSGSISFHELHVMLQKKDMIRWLKKEGLVAHEVVGLFMLMDDGDNTVSFCEFISGIMRLNAAKKGLDLPTLLYENKKILKRVLAVGSQVDELADRLKKIS